MTRASTEAAVHFERGVTYYREADYSAALVEFKRAYDIAPKWRVLFNIGQAYFQLHEYVDALSTVQRFLEQGGDAIEPKHRAELDAELEDLRDRVGVVTIESNVPGCTVSIDDRPVGVASPRRSILVNAGVRRVTAELGERRAVERRISVVGGESMTVLLEFPPLPSQPPTQTVPAAAPLPSQGRTAPAARVPSLVAFTAATAGVIAGGVFGVLAIQDRSTLDSACAGGGACPESARPTLDAMTRNALISNIGWGVAAVGVATGLTLWFTAGGSSGKSPAERPVSIRVRVGPGFLFGSF